MSMQYESSQVGAFMYMWGFSDARSGIVKPSGLLANSQNKLDHLIGDLLGAINVSESLERRWFLAEFKRDRKGFYEEVHLKKAKPHRQALYRHLRCDDGCRDLARFGHFAVWGNINDQLVIEPYAHAVGPGPAGGPGPGLHPLDYASMKAEFEPFYKNLHDPLMDRFVSNEDLYGAGLGLPTSGMQKYLRCMLQFAIPLPTSPSIIAKSAQHLLFGYTQSSGSSELVLTSYEGIWDSCNRFTTMTAKGLALPPPNVTSVRKKPQK